MGAGTHPWVLLTVEPCPQLPGLLSCGVRPVCPSWPSASSLDIPRPCAECSLSGDPLAGPGWLGETSPTLLPLLPRLSWNPFFLSFSSSCHCSSSFCGKNPDQLLTAPAAEVTRASSSAAAAASQKRTSMVMLWQDMLRSSKHSKAPMFVCTDHMTC